ncbi:MAG: hypothetical protein KJ600_01675 [Nanoarchaeota archaeon]|nr:hypothetical protein [Nanoarchaeota archaeon]MBU1103248.1 hypothetical protein [Nanoarchaeota archaeon]
MKILPKNHNERFDLLDKYLPEVYKKVSELFKKYRESYNLRLTKLDASKVKEYAYELRDIVKNKK